MRRTLYIPEDIYDALPSPKWQTLSGQVEAPKIDPVDLIEIVKGTENLKFKPVAFDIDENLFTNITEAYGKTLSRFVIVYILLEVINNA